MAEDKPWRVYNPSKSTHLAEKYCTILTDNININGNDALARLEWDCDDVTRCSNQVSLVFSRGGAGAPAGAAGGYWR
jgi:hypothetical protein